MFAGRIAQGDSTRSIFETDTHMRVVADDSRTASADVRFVGVRPESVTVMPLANTATATEPNTFPATIRSVLYRGWTRELVITLQTGETLKAVQVLTGASQRDLPADGAVSVTWPADACHLLEAD